MSRSELAALIISVIGIMIIPAIGLLIRLTIKWTRAEAALEDLVDDMKKLVDDKDRVHKALYDMMKDDRDANDRRLRWLEENVWKGRTR